MKGIWLWVSRYHGDRVVEDTYHITTMSVVQFWSRTLVPSAFPYASCLYLYCKLSHTGKIPKKNYGLHLTNEHPEQVIIHLHLS